MDRPSHLLAGVYKEREGVGGEGGRQAGLSQRESNS